MNLSKILSGAALAALLAVGGCGSQTKESATPTDAVKEAAGDSTITAGLGDVGSPGTELEFAL